MFAGYFYGGDCYIGEHCLTAYNASILSPLKVQYSWNVTKVDRPQNNYISSVSSPFSNWVGLPLHNIPSSGVIMKSIGAELF